MGFQVKQIYVTPEINISQLPKHRYLMWMITAMLTCAAIAGTFGTNWWGESVWNFQTNRDQFLLFVVVSYCLYFLLSRCGLTIFALLGLPFAFYVASAGLGPVVAVIWFWCCANIVGRMSTVWIARFSGLELSTESSTWDLRNTAIGFCLLGTLIALLAHFPVCTPLVFFTLFSGFAVAASYFLMSQGKLSPPKLPCFFRKVEWKESILVAMLMLGVTIVIMVTILPDLGHDALSFHLNIPVRMLDAGLWNFDVKEYVWSVMPFGADWLYVPPYFFGGEQAVRLMNTSFLLATGYLGYRLLAGRLDALLAMGVPAILFTLPISLLEVGSAYIEAPLTFFFMIALCEIAGGEYKTIRQKGSWIILGILAGYICAIKLPGFLIVPFLALGALLRSVEDKFEVFRFKFILTSGIAFLIFCSPPYAVAWFKTGNPVFPFFNQIFNSPYFDTQTSFTNSHFVRSIGLQTFWDMSVSSKDFGEFSANGALGIVFLVFIPLSILLAVKLKRWAILFTGVSAIAYIGLCFHNQAYLRYAFPVMPWLLCSGVWALYSAVNLRGVLVGLLVIFCSFNLARFPVVYWPFQQFKTDLLWSRSAQEGLFARSKPQAIAGDILSKLDQYKGRKILILDATSDIDPTYNHYPKGTIAASWHSWPYYAKSTSDINLANSLARSGVEIIVYAVGRGYQFEAEAIALTTELFRVNDIRVGLVNQIELSKLFKKEFISNPDFSNGADGWTSNGALFKDEKFYASVGSPVTQAVDVGSVDVVALTVQAKCDKSQRFRTQINWNDTNGKMLSTDIKVHDCNGGLTTATRLVIKPERAKIAIVYGGSHDARPVEINRISVT
ncbi:hypothetical protein QN372_18880, partial [Undibacterium sp. RTI2.1]